MKKSRRNLVVTACLIASFVIWTALVKNVDVRDIGPLGSSVGFSGINQLFHTLTDTSFSLYIITDYLSVIPFGICAGFGILGVVQLIKRKSLLNVDRDLLVLGGFYAVTIAVYLLFEVFVINYRPILIEGVLEASYPSSTTMLVICVMSTAIMQFNSRIKLRGIRVTVNLASAVFTVFMVTGRILSGVHWFSDIIGGILLAAGLVMAYYSVTALVCEK